MHPVNRECTWIMGGSTVFLDKNYKKKLITCYIPLWCNTKPRSTIVFMFMQPRESQVEPPTMTTQGHTDLGLSPILWHALDIWQCTKQGYESLQEAIEDLVSCSTDFDINSW